MNQEEITIPETGRTDRYTAWYGRRRLRLAAWLSSVVLYAVIVVTLGDFLKISSNYFVVIPLIVAAFAYGRAGGIISGVLALPANLLLFRLIGHMEYSPASHVIAEGTGVIVGTTLGILGDRFRRLGDEIQRRTKVEKTLRAALEERNLLIREIHHRVKNNLSVIKGMVSLQRMNAHDEASEAAFADLANRLISLSLVQDQLSESTSFTQEINVGDYLTELISNITEGHGHIEADIRLWITGNLPSIHIDRVAPLGIMVNEAVANAYKHAFPGTANPVLRVDVSRDAGNLLIVIADNGPGYDGAIPEGPHLGRSIMDALAAQVRGEVRFDGRNGTTVMISVPVDPSEDDSEPAPVV